MKSMPGLFRKLLVVSLLGIALLAVGCKRDAPQQPVDPATDDTGAVDAVAVIETSPADSITAMSKGFDSKSFAGTFGGTLPCASCPGIDTTVELNADGTFILTETYQDEEAGPQKLDGTWTVEADGKHLRLDPSSKADADRLYGIMSNDEIMALAADGGLPESKVDYSLKRTGSTQ